MPEGSSNLGTSGSSASPLLELELLLESLPGSFGGGAVGNGCCVAASPGEVFGDPSGASGVVAGAGLGGCPGNGKRSVVDFFSAGAGVQGLFA